MATTCPEARSMKPLNDLFPRCVDEPDDIAVPRRSMKPFNDLFPAWTESPEATYRLGQEFAKQLGAGNVVSLQGKLGTGKTTFTKGVGRGLGIDPDHITSPTFTLLNEYSGGTLPVYHFDAYRIGSLEEFFDLGYEEYVYGSGVCVIEWADRIEPLLPVEAIRIRLEHEAKNRRRFILTTAYDPGK